MTRTSFLQGMKPFVRYCMLLTPVVLIITVFSSGVFTFPAANTSHVVDAKLSSDNIALTPSTKYAAVNMQGLDRNSDVKVVSATSFSSLIATATNHPRKRKMNDLTKDAENNSMQILINTWTDGSYSPVHKHIEYSEAFVTLQGALAFFTYSDDGATVKCNIIHSLTPDAERLILVEKGQYHAMTAAPVSMGWPGHAVVFESSGHTFDLAKQTKILANFAPVYGDGMDGDPVYFEKILQACPKYSSV